MSKYGWVAKSERLGLIHREKAFRLISERGGVWACQAAG